MSHGLSRAPQATSRYAKSGLVLQHGAGKARTQRTIVQAATLKTVASIIAMLLLSGCAVNDPYQLRARLLRAEQVRETTLDHVGELAQAYTDGRREMPAIGTPRWRMLYELLLQQYLARPRRGTVAALLVDAPLDPVRRLAAARSEQAALSYCLLRLAYDRTDEAAAEHLFGHSLHAVGAAARRTLWPTEVPSHEGSEVYLELCGRIQGRTAKDVLYLQGSPRDGNFDYIILAKERYYCFRMAASDDKDVYYVEVDRVILDHFGPSLQVGTRDYVRSVKRAAPAGMQEKLPRLKLSDENRYHWYQNAFDTPAWSAPYIPEPYHAVLEPTDENRADEKDPELVESDAPRQDPEEVGGAETTYDN